MVDLISRTYLLKIGLSYLNLPSRLSQIQINGGSVAYPGNIDIRPLIGQYILDNTITVSPWLEKGIVRKINNGRTTLIYHHEWILNFSGLLRIPFNNEYIHRMASSVHYTITVYDLFNTDTSTWNWPLIIDSQLPIEARQFLGVTDLIPNLPDTWQWHNSFGEYSVASGYKVIIQHF